MPRFVWLELRVCTNCGLWRTQLCFPLPIARFPFPIFHFPCPVEFPTFGLGNVIYCPALEPPDLSDSFNPLSLAFSHPEALGLLPKKKKFPAFRVLKIWLIVVLGDCVCSFACVLLRIFGFFPNNNYFRFVFFQA